MAENEPLKLHERINLHSGISRIKRIAEEEFGGDINCNILEIFERLPEIEKRAILKEFAAISFILGDDPACSCDGLSNEDRVKGQIYATLKTQTEDIKKAVKSTSVDIEEYNKQQMINLKVWLVRVIVICTIIACIFLITLIAVSSNLNAIDLVFNTFDSIGEVIKLIFGVS